MSTRTAKARTATPPVQGGNPLADRLGEMAREYRATGHRLARDLPGFDLELSGMIADEIDRLAQLVRFTGAATPAEHRERLEVMDRDRDEDIIRRAYADGYDHGRREGRDLAFAEITVVLKRSVGLR